MFASKCFLGLFIFLGNAGINE
jgi:alpha-galactosidase